MSDPLDPEDFYDLTLVSAPVVSPSGDRVAFVADEFDHEADERRTSLFVAPADGSRDPHRLTRDADASDPTWSPDGSKLAFRAARETDTEIAVNQGDHENSGEEDSNSEDDSSGDESTNGEPDDEETEPNPQIWAFDLERGGDARQLTTFEEGARGYDWGPDGDRLVVAARDPDDEQRDYLRARREDDAPVETERLQHKYDGTGWLDDVRTYLFVVEYDSRETIRLDDAYGGGAREPMTGLNPAWSPAPVAGAEDHRIAFLSNRTDRPDDNYVMDVYTVAPDGSDLRKLTNSDLTASRLRWHPAGDRLAFVGRDPENGHVPAEPYVVEFAAAVDSTAAANSASSEEPVVSVGSWAGDLDRTVASFGGPAWDGDDLLAPIGDEGLTRLATFRADERPERTFDAQGRDRTVEGFDCRGRTAAVVLSDPESGRELHALGTGSLDSLGSTAEPTQLTEATADLVADHRMPDCRRITVESEGEEIDAIVYLPADFDPSESDVAGESEGDTVPLVASVHGGPVSYDAPTFEFLYAYLTGQGYAVVRPNYRGSSSYGREFSEAIRGDWGPRETADVLACVDELIDRGVADPDQLFATGFSYGAITTAYLVAETDRFAAAAAEHGVYDFRSAFGIDDSHVWWANDFGLPWENPERYDDAGSIADVGEMDTPLLVTAGGEDWRCPPSQSEQLYVSLKKQGVPARLVVYPDEHHAIGDPDRAVHRLTELTDWFERFDPETQE
ncbi:S9 family peptidase [Halorussus litoreus]|uniref:S9 family peptidase n=1 Tax=Halorussus litoreus TaxID=1710536 RepID=UPI000E23B941|nr:S9 family peptidase [Halorussus litoreus]